MDLTFKTSQSSQDIGEAVYRDHLPQGRAWWFLSRFGGAIVASAGACWAYAKNYADYIKAEINIDTTVDAIEEHEESVGLPDGCSIRASTIELRRGQVKARLKKTPAVLEREIEKIVLKLSGFSVLVVPRRAGNNIHNGSFDFSGLDSAGFATHQDLFTFDVFVKWQSSGTFDYVPFGSEFDGTPKPTSIECLINKIKPCNSVAIFSYSTDLFNRQKEMM